MLSVTLDTLAYPAHEGHEIVGLVIPGILPGVLMLRILIRRIAPGHWGFSLSLPWISSAFSTKYPAFLKFLLER